MYTYHNLVASLLSIYFNEMKNYSHTEMYANAKNWTQTLMYSNWWIDKRWYIHTLEYRLSVHTTTWMDIKGIMISERSKTQKATCIVWFHFYGVLVDKEYGEGVTTKGLRTFLGMVSVYVCSISWLLWLYDYVFFKLKYNWKIVNFSTSKLHLN